MRVELAMVVAYGEASLTNIRPLPNVRFDDVLVTEEGCEILTDGVPRDPDEIEALMAEARGQTRLPFGAHA